MKRTVAQLVLGCLFGTAITAAQTPEEPPPAAAPESAEAPVSLKQVPLDILHAQKTAWSFPLKAVRGEHWRPVLAVIVGTTGLAALDPHVESYFHDRSGFNAYKTGPLRGRNTTLAIALPPAAFYLAGLAQHRTHARNTGLLAAEGLADAQVVTFAIKHAVGRLVPSDIPPHGDLGDTWFKYRGTFGNGGSFPSGHAASAFAVATVISGRHRTHRWVPWVAYGAATLISLTRLPDQAHFPSDLFVGAALGYGIGRVVLLQK